jgi:hypothetical protein
MTAQADRFREEQTAAEWRESRDEELQDWVRRSLEYLSGLYEPPWNDAGPGDNHQISEGARTMATIRTAGGEVSGTFRVYDGDTFIGYVLTAAEPGSGPHWTRQLGYQGRTAKGTVANWAPGKDEAIAALLAASQAEISSEETGR